MFNTILEPTPYLQEFIIYHRCPVQRITWWSHRLPFQMRAVFKSTLNPDLTVRYKAARYKQGLTTLTTVQLKSPGPYLQALEDTRRSTSPGLGPTPILIYCCRFLTPSHIFLPSVGFQNISDVQGLQFIITHFRAAA